MGREAQARRENEGKPRKGGMKLPGDKLKGAVPRPGVGGGCGMGPEREEGMQRNEADRETRAALFSACGHFTEFK